MSDETYTLNYIIECNFYFWAEKLELAMFYPTSSFSIPKYFVLDTITTKLTFQEAVEMTQFLQASLLLFQGTWVQLLASTWQPTTICNSHSRRLSASSDLHGLK